MLKGTSLGSTLRTRALADRALFRTRPGVYACAELAPLPTYVVTEHGVAPAYVAHVRAVLLSLGARATASGRTAAALRGWALLVEPSRTVEVAVPHGRSRARLKQVRITQRRSIMREHLVVLEGTDAVWVTSAEQTVLDCCLELPTVEAVVVGDSALRAKVVTLEQLERLARAQRGVRDAAKVRRVLALLDPESGSVLESVLRYRLLAAGVTGFATQHHIGGPAGARVRVDFCFPDCRLVIEADGAKWHPDPGPDRQRDNLLARRGFRVLRYTWAEVVHDHARVVEEICEAAGVGREDFQFTPVFAGRAA
jgi:very-short-patch-repair endonuclease